MRLPGRSFHRGLALLVAAAFFMENLDGTIIQTAAPAIAADFGVAPADTNIAMVSYLMAVAVCIPASGWIADRYGTRRVFLVAVVIFTLASLVCAFSPSLAVLTVARAIQGIGGALMIPVGRLAVLRATSRTDLLEAIAYLTWPALLAPVVAPFLGGLLADTIGWPWIFLLNLPIGVITFAAGVILLRPGDTAASGRFDVVGFTGIAASLVLVSAGAELLSGAGKGGVILGAAVTIAGMVAGALTIRGMRRAAHPLFDWSALRTQSFRVGNVSGGVYRLMITGAPFLFTLQFQVAFGWSASAAGLAVMVIFIGNVAIKPATTPLLRRWGFRRVLIWSNILGTLILVCFVMVDERTPVLLILVLLLLSGVFRSIGFTAYNTLQFVDVDSDGLTDANTLSSTIQQVATALGVAVVAVFVRTGTWIAEQLHGSVILGYSIAFLLSAVLMLIPVWGAFSLHSNAGMAAIRRSAVN